jgi:hypothetical protein
VPENEYTLQVSPELHSLIASVLSEAANLKKLIVTPSTRLRRKSGRQYRLRKALAVALKEIVAGIPLTEFLNVKVRNTLEHFDEYLDEVNLAASMDQLPPSPVAADNMVLSHWEVFYPRAYLIRVYISSKRKFYNMKWSVDLGAMNSEASTIGERLRTLPGFSDKENPGALMLHMT